MPSMGYGPDKSPHKWRWHSDIDKWVLKMKQPNTSGMISAMKKNREGWVDSDQMVRQQLSEEAAMGRAPVIRQSPLDSLGRALQAKRRAGWGHAGVAEAVSKQKWGRAAEPRLETGHTGLCRPR